MSIFCLKGISKIFKTHSGDFYALKNINLELSSTGLTSIIGKSGSGKSTLLNILLGIEKPTSGSLLFNNKNISKMSDKRFSQYHLNDISMVFQHYNIFLELTALENIILPLLMKGMSRNNAVKRGKELLDEFKMKNLMNQKCKTLSGGEKQRVAILRAIGTAPKVLLCDEPTGALDSKNSEAIMEILKKLSKSILVVLVSHNKELVKKYSDRIITLKDGMIESDKTLFQTSEKVGLLRSSKYSSKWNSLFTKLNLRLNFKKNIFSFISTCFGFTSIFLSIGFYAGSQISQDNALKNNLAITHATASEKTYFTIENSPLSYEKSVRPSLTSIDKYMSDFDEIIYEPNLTFLFPTFPYGSYKGEMVDNFRLIPIYDISLESYGKDLLVEGETPNGNLLDVLVNEEFVKELSLSNEEIIDDLFNITYSASISFVTENYDNPFIKDEYSFDYDLHVVGVVKEFSFLNTPKIYYSYPALKKELSTIYLENISSYLGRPVTCLDYIVDASDDDPISSYSFEVFISKIEDSSKFFSRIKELNESEATFQIESDAYDIQQSYKTFIESFSTALFIFTIIAFIGVNFILGMIGLSSFIENKKNSAILTCLGAKNSSIQSIYLSENYLIVIVSLILSIPLAMLSEFILNSLIEKSFSLSNLISIPFIRFMGVPFLLPIGLALVALLFSSLFTLTPMLIYRHISLSDELRDE